MTSGKSKVINDYGIHARPSAVIISTIRKMFPGAHVTLGCNGIEVSVSSIMDIMSMGLDKGQEVSITVEGPDAETEVLACRKMEELISTNFDFER
jgi:phosphocarrier protein HPr